VAEELSRDEVKERLEAIFNSSMEGKELDKALASIEKRLDKFEGKWGGLIKWAESKHGKPESEDAPAAEPAEPVESEDAPAAEPAEPEVIDVEPVVLGSATYLVDKQSGMVYSNVLQPGKEPVVVGRWNAKREKGSFEEHPSGQRQTATVDTQLDSVPEQSTRAKRADGEPGDKEAAPAVRFAAHAQVDAGAVPTVKSDFGKLPTTDGTEAVPPGQNVAPPVSVIPTSEQLKQRGERAHGDKPLQWLAAHSLASWPGKAPEPVVLQQTEQPARGQYHQKTDPVPLARKPAPRSPRWDLLSTPDEAVAGRDLAPSSPRGLRRPIEDGIRALRSLNGTKHTGDSHTPGVSQSRTLPPQQRGWAGLTDDPVVKARRDGARAQRRAKPARQLNPAEEAAFAAQLALERRVLASDQQSWAYLSLAAMSGSADTAPAEGRVSTGNYRLGPRVRLDEEGEKPRRSVHFADENAEAAEAEAEVEPEPEQEQQEQQRGASPEVGAAT